MQGHIIRQLWEAHRGQAARFTEGFVGIVLEQETDSGLISTGTPGQGE